MSPVTKWTEYRTPSFPRVSGDEPQLADAIPGASGFSPRERG